MPNQRASHTNLVMAAACICSSNQMAHVTGDLTIGSLGSAGRLPSASIQACLSPTQDLDARTLEHCWRKIWIRPWRETDIFPQIGSRPITDIDAPELLEMLRKVEKRGVIETARRLRQLCGQVFRYAIVTGRAQHDPSADLRGALKSPGRPRGHKAMLLDEVPTFMHALGAYDGDARTRLALRLMVLTFARTTELRAARWSEFENLEGNDPLWRIPSERMKMKREHLVPLAPQAVAVLQELRALSRSADSPFLFPSPSRDGYMSNNTMLYALYRMGYHGRVTVHGF